MSEVRWGHPSFRAHNVPSIRNFIYWERTHTSSYHHIPPYFQWCYWPVLSANNKKGKWKNFSVFLGIQNFSFWCMTKVKFRKLFTHKRHTKHLLSCKFHKFRQPIQPTYSEVVSPSDHTIKQCRIEQPLANLSNSYNSKWKHFPSELSLIFQCWNDE